MFLRDFDFPFDTSLSSFLIYFPGGPKALYTLKQTCNFQL